MVPLHFNFQHFLHQKSVSTIIHQFLSASKTHWTVLHGSNVFHWWQSSANIQNWKRQFLMVGSQPKTKKKFGRIKYTGKECQEKSHWEWGCALKHAIACSTFFQDWPHFLGENPIWPQQFLVKNNSDFFQSFSFFRLCLSRISIIFQGFTLLKGFAAQRRQLLTKFL